MGSVYPPEISESAIHFLCKGRWRTHEKRPAAKISPTVEDEPESSSGKRRKASGEEPDSNRPLESPAVVRPPVSPTAARQEAEMRGWPHNLPLWNYCEAPTCRSYPEFVAKYKITNMLAEGVTGSVRAGAVDSKKGIKRSKFQERSITRSFLNYNKNGRTTERCGKCNILCMHTRSAYLNCRAVRKSPGSHSWQII